ncbi:hypothetical protein N7474_005192 [Penicillium riverlandense]|uniref:uncharacterized protein n=1 Tax=Penicillium riverlandense TaxID=1903569 RepID=UPI0025499588|nr:uncharacterized protein N7474_005192 [Penicillium riverlandense]KAJ5819601.1 hypothetical protein N7474_005192 [Penicillium riverlandense]
MAADLGSSFILIRLMLKLTLQNWHGGLWIATSLKQELGSNILLNSLPYKMGAGEEIPRCGALHY